MQRVLRRAQDEDGFTLIELMVVVMILAILMVMGLPTFLGVKARFQDRAAQTDLRNTVLARGSSSRTSELQHRQRDPVGLVTIVATCATWPAERRRCERNRPVRSGAGDGSISVSSSATQFSAARMSTSKTCFLVVDT